MKTRAARSDIPPGWETERRRGGGAEEEKADRYGMAGLGLGG